MKKRGKSLEDQSVGIYANGEELLPGNLVEATGLAIRVQATYTLILSSDQKIPYAIDQRLVLERGKILMYLGCKEAEYKQKHILSFLLDEKTINIVYHDVLIGDMFDGQNGGGRFIDIGAAFIKVLDI